jgi:hypothetical protein
VGSTASGKGAKLGMGDWADDDLVANVGALSPGGSSPAVNDWFWGGGAPDPTIIPWTWLSMPLQLRSDQPINHAEISRTGGSAAIADAATSQLAYGVFAASGELTTASVDDAQNFANFLIAYYANPLVRCPVLTFDLVHRTVDERWRILDRELGDRVTLGPGVVPSPSGPITLPVPAGLPIGATSLVIEGIAHSSSVTGRVTEWTTAPLLGSTPGTEGPWFRVDTSRMDGTDVMPF